MPRPERMEFCGIELNGCDWLPGCSACSELTPEAPAEDTSWSRCQRCGSVVTWIVVAAEDIPDDPWDWDRIGVSFGARAR